MKIIIASKGEKIKVSDRDYYSLKKYYWSVDRLGYPQKARKKNGVWMPISMHRFILGEENRLHIDHKNGDKLDNRRCNLRFCTSAENVRNSRIKNTNKSGYKGVWYAPKNKKYSAQVWYNYKKYHIGYFCNKKDAARAYNKLAKILHGKFANLNIV